MKKLANKITSFFLLLAMPVMAIPTFRQLILPAAAQAQTINAPMFYSQNVSNGTIVSNVGIGAGYKFNGTNISDSSGMFQYFGTIGTNYVLPLTPVSDKLTQIDFQIKDVYGGNTSHPTDTFLAYAKCVDNSSHYSTNYVQYGDLTSSYGTFGFFFDLSSTCDFSNGLKVIGLVPVGPGGSGGGHYNTGTNSLYQGFLGTNSNTVSGLSLGTGASAASYSLWFNLHDENHVGISFQNPPYYNGMQTPDFNNWAACVYLASDHANTGHYVDISYRHTSTTTPEYLDSSFVQVGVIRDQLGQTTNECEILSKNNALSPGDYTATADLYDQDGSLLFESAALTFTITTGSAVDYPNQQPPNQSAQSLDCEQSNVIVKGICQVMGYLFVPPNNSLSQFQSLWDGIKTKPPFGYFVAAQTALSGLTIGSPAASLQGISLLSVFFSPIRIGFTLLIFFLAGLYIFQRLSHFNF